MPRVVVQPALQRRLPLTLAAWSAPLAPPFPPQFLMLRPDRRSRVLMCALAMLAIPSPAVRADLVAQEMMPLAWPGETTLPEADRASTQPAPLGMADELPAPEANSVQGVAPKSRDAAVEVIPFEEFSPGDEWTWQWMPAGLIYHSYMAGVHEPRMAIVAFYESGDRTLWDATLGGRVGLVRCGDCDPHFPQGFQLDFYGAAVARLDVENRQDLDSTDYVFGFPITYGVGAWQFKFGYAHLSSHLGDELALREPDTLDERVNYVRDAIVLGGSVYPHPIWRQYAEVGWAFHNSDGAQPWDAQFGSEFSKPGPTGPGGSPFLAVNGRLREEHDFGGDLSIQAGWLRRGVLGQTLRFGVHYYNGKSSQFQFFDNFEEQIGLGLWYDY